MKKMPLLISNWEEERKCGFVKFFVRKTITLLFIFFITELISILLNYKTIEFERFLTIIIVVIIVVVISWFGRELWFKKITS
jgi:cell division protein FtsW (lipid II flippase)